MVSFFCLHISVNTRYPEMKSVVPDKIKFYLKHIVSSKRWPAECEGKKAAGTNSRSSWNEPVSCFLFRSTPNSQVIFIKSFKLRLWHQIKGAILSAFVLLCWPFFAPFVRIINESLVIINKCLSLISPASQNIFFPDRKPLITALSCRLCRAAISFDPRDKEINMLL